MAASKMPRTASAKNVLLSTRRLPPQAGQGPFWRAKIQRPNVWKSLRLCLEFSYKKDHWRGDPGTVVNAKVAVITAS